jgi:hypothetical protein
MFRLAFLLLIAADVHAAAPPVDIDTAAQIYQEAGIRAQVRASLGSMPDHIRRLFEGNTSTPLTDTQRDAVTAAAKRGFRIDVFEAPALSAFAANLDSETVKKTEAFLSTDVAKRWVAADIALATLDDALVDKIMNGEKSAVYPPERVALIEKLEYAERSTESTVQILLAMGTAVALGTAVGSGMDPSAVEDRARKSGEASRHALEENMREPLRRYLSYGYRDLSDADLKHVLAFLQSPAGKRYNSAYIASLDAGFFAMGRRCGEQLGESMRELAQAQLATESAQREPPPDLKQPPEPKNHE